jgi:hypothetical protein
MGMTLRALPLALALLLGAAPPSAGGHSPGDFDRHVKRLKRRLPRGFTVVVQTPFVVIGDEPAGRVRLRARLTVKWAVDKLKQAYFSRDPDQILEIWLFKNRRSYLRHTRRLFGERPGTPYGYYSSRHRALIMNIATGGGTLVHEIVHPLMEANFPDCPAWFNEGLGSLYEQSSACAVGICGLTNWRLPGLQRAIRAGMVPSFRWLTSRTSDQFYGEDPGTNYAQARYLLYFLQQRGLLRKYYRRFYRARRRDPTGYKTLVKLLGASDMRVFQRNWEDWVLRLRFR